MEFKNRLKGLRAEKGINTTTLAAQFGKSDTAVRMWETGRSKPDVDTLVKLAEYFGCTTDYLLGMSEFKNGGEQKAFDEDLEGVSSAVAKLTNREKKRVLNLVEIVCNSLKDFSEQDNFRAVYLHHLYEIVGCISVQILQCSLMSGGEKIGGVLGDRAVKDAVSFVVFRSYMWRSEAAKYIDDIYDRLEKKLGDATSVNVEALKRGNWFEESKNMYRELWESYSDEIGDVTNADT